MKAVAAFLILLAALVVVVPRFTDCQSQGKAVQLANGKTLPMKCHWTAQAELLLGVPMGLCGIFLFRRPVNQARSELAILTVTLGMLAILVPTAVIGVCTREDMLCSAVMKPTLIASGFLAMLIGAAFLFAGVRRDEDR